ncbi:hypothetical protein AAG570_002173 [Ranatra chinensis]|uniref:VWFC domain-containing protein n=1 Tax=Ranatra chinensis TaxID=642074 RepID=A0ABD0Y6S5_9HEMI
MAISRNRFEPINSERKTTDFDAMKDIAPGCVTLGLPQQPHNCGQVRNVTAQLRNTQILCKLVALVNPAVSRRYLQIPTDELQSLHYCNRMSVGALTGALCAIMSQHEHVACPTDHQFNECVRIFPVILKPAVRYYKELNCDPITDPSGELKRYNCKILDELKDDKCYYNGKEYSEGEHVTREDLRDNCIVECSCDKHLKKAYFTCVNIECPSLFRPAPEEGCTDLYDHAHCCPQKKHCDHKDEPLPTCEYNGKTYKYGQMIYPKGCQSCICGEGWNGTLGEPWCRPVLCEMFLHYGNWLRQGCVPTYYTPDDCCPIPEWRCPSEADTIIDPEPSKIATPKSKDEMCRFGKLDLAVGQMLSPVKDSCVQCSCVMPPHVSCIMNTTCHEAPFTSIK